MSNAPLAFKAPAVVEEALIHRMSRDAAKRWHHHQAGNRSEMEMEGEWEGKEVEGRGRSVCSSRVEPWRCRSPHSAEEVVGSWRRSERVGEREREREREGEGETGKWGL